MIDALAVVVDVALDRTAGGAALSYSGHCGVRRNSRAVCVGAWQIDASGLSFGPNLSCAFTAKPKTDSIAASMLRRTALAIAVISFSSIASAGELCVVCAKPDATYRCTLDQSTRFGNFRFGEEIQVRVCTKVLAKKGSHERCTVVQNANAACDGPLKTITFTDYQQVLASDGSSTYEPGLVALIGNKINKTWICITSIFKDC